MVSFADEGAAPSALNRRIAPQTIPPTTSAMEPDQQWINGKQLRNSDDHLNWMHPRPDHRIAASPHPSFLNSLTTTPGVDANPIAPASTRVTKSSHEFAPGDTDSRLSSGSLSAAPSLPPLVSQRATPLGGSARIDHRLRPVAAQQSGTGAPSDAPTDTFDEVLDELLPEDELPEPMIDELPEELGESSTSQQPPDNSVFPESAAPDLEDGFGDEPSGETGVPATDESDLPSDLPFDQLEGAEPGDDLPRQDVDPNDGLPPADLAPPPTMDERTRELVPDDLRPFPERDSMSPLREPGDSVVDFNGRNCPEELADLQDAWERLRQTPIQSITLDITPSVEPTDQSDDLGESPQVAVKRSPSRVWHSRQGALLMEGRMEDFRNGKVLIRPADGTSRWLSWYDLSNEDLCFVSAWWGIPSEFNPEVRPYELRNWTMTTFTWAASGLCHKPLYFEEVQLERYGHTAGPVKQAMLSGAHFFGNIFFLPYHMGLNPPNECQYALGYYRPGDCAPWMLPAVPLSARGFRYQMGALVSGLTLLP